MPNFEEAAFSRRTQQGSSAYSYDKIYAVLNKNSASDTSDTSTFSRGNKFSVSLKDSIGFYDIIGKLPSGEYQKAAAADLSTIFIPFQSKANQTGGFPGFTSGVKTTNFSPPLASGNIELHHILPFQWEPSQTSVVYDRWFLNRSDPMNDYLSGEQLYGDSNQYRDMSDIRGVGLRLPLMGVGWGYTLVDNHPWPSGTSRRFKGGLPSGWMLDPSDYIAAPIDLRYDVTRHVWTCGSAPTTSSLSVSWGRVTADWTPGTNNVVLQPCVGPTNSTAIASGNVDCFIQLPFNRAAVSLGATTNDILAYISVGSGINMLFAQPVLPRPSGAYQGIFNQSVVTPYYAADYTRGF